MARMSGKTALITGGGSGIGEACALLFAQEGARVFLSGRTESKLQAVADQVKKDGGEADYMAGDLVDADVVDRVFDAAVETMGRVDCLVNSAAVGYNWNDVSPGSMADIADTPIDKYREVMGLNLDSTYFMTRRAVQHMRTNKSGSIVNISSVYGIVGAIDAHTYAITKAAVQHLTKCIAYRYASEGVRCNCIAPGFTATPMTENVMSWFDDKEAAAALIPMARPGTPTEIAQGCLFFASDESSYATGAMLPIDGGWTSK